VPAHNKRCCYYYYLLIHGVHVKPKYSPVVLYDNWLSLSVSLFIVLLWPSGGMKELTTAVNYNKDCV